MNLALEHVASLNSKGFAATIDILGEHTKNIDIATSVTTNYCDLLKKLTICLLIVIYQLSLVILG